MVAACHAPVAPMPAPLGQHPELRCRLPPRRYEAVQPLHASWQQYMRDLLASGGGPGSADVEARLYAADLHGCLIRVAQTAGEGTARKVMGGAFVGCGACLSARALCSAFWLHATAMHLCGEVVEPACLTGVLHAHVYVSACKQASTPPRIAQQS